MEFIKNYFNQIELNTEDHLEDQSDEKTKSKITHSTKTTEEKDEKWIIQNLIEELLFKVEIDDQIKSNKVKNEDEIIISSSESDESSFERLSNADSDLNSDAELLETSELDRCLETRFVPLKTKGELLIEELPAPEDETIQLSFNIDQLQQIGNVSKILNNLVIVESFKNLPALDLDSVLFFRTGLSIGRIFDVIGSVTKPFYVIRFASNEKIQDNQIFINMPVYFVPPNLCVSKFQDLNVTKYVLVSQLKNTKGSDASWEHNNEPPENVKEYSDDEEERKDQMKMKSKRKPTNSSSNSNASNLRFKRNRFDNN